MYRKLVSTTNKSSFFSELARKVILHRVSSAKNPSEIYAGLSNKYKLDENFMMDTIYSMMNNLQKEIYKKIPFMDRRGRRECIIRDAYAERVCSLIKSLPDEMHYNNKSLWIKQFECLGNDISVVKLFQALPDSLKKDPEVIRAFFRAGINYYIKTDILFKALSPELHYDINTIKIFLDYPDNDIPRYAKHRRHGHSTYHKDNKQSTVSLFAALPEKMQSKLSVVKLFEKADDYNSFGNIFKTLAETLKNKVDMNKIQSYMEKMDSADAVFLASFSEVAKKDIHIAKLSIKRLASYTNICDYNEIANKIINFYGTLSEVLKNDVHIIESIVENLIPARIIEFYNALPETLKNDPRVIKLIIKELSPRYTSFDGYYRYTGNFGLSLCQQKSRAEKNNSNQTNQNIRYFYSLLPEALKNNKKITALFSDGTNAEVMRENVDAALAKIFKLTDERIETRTEEEEEYAEGIIYEGSDQVVSGRYPTGRMVSVTKDVSLGWWCDVARIKTIIEAIPDADTRIAVIREAKKILSHVPEYSNSPELKNYSELIAMLKEIEGSK